MFDKGLSVESNTDTHSESMKEKEIAAKLLPIDLHSRGSWLLRRKRTIC